MSATIWIDAQGNELSREDISDRYLLNILRFICKGGGHTYFLTYAAIQELFSEAKLRGLKHGYKAQDAENALDEKLYREAVWSELHWELDW